MKLLIDDVKVHIPHELRERHKGAFLNLVIFESEKALNKIVDKMGDDIRRDLSKTRLDYNTESGRYRYVIFSDTPLAQSGHDDYGPVAIVTRKLT